MHPAQSLRKTFWGIHAVFTTSMSVPRSGQFSMLLQVLSTEERYQTAVLMRASKQQQAGAVNQGRYVAKW